MAKEEFQYGDKVHLGFGKKGGAGMFGTVHKFHGNDTVEVKSRDKHYNGITKKHEHKFWKGPRSHLTRNENVNEVVGPVAARAATIAARTLHKAYFSQGGSSVLKGIGAGIATAAEVVRRKLTSSSSSSPKPKNDYTTGGGFGTTSNGKHYEYKTEAEMSDSKADQQAKDRKTWDNIKLVPPKDKPKTYTHFRKDGKRIKVTIPEGYAGGATISHNHGNPAPDLTKDTKVSSVHKPGRSSSTPGTATPPSYGVKARDMTKNSNPHTRHKPLTAGRIKEGGEMKDKDLRQIVEMYDHTMPAPGGASKESQKLQEFSHHAGEYHFHKRMAEDHHRMAGQHEEEHGVTPLGEAHYHKSMYHEKMTAHHGEQLAKDHGMDRGKVAHLCHKHRDSAHDFTLALAAEGKEPLKKAKPSRGSWKFKK